MDTIWSIITICNVISVVTLVALMTIYFRNLRHMKSNLLIGLLLFAAIFLVQNIISLYYYFTMMDYYVRDVRNHQFILTVLQTIAFLVMLKITWE
jgi:hypothetical protein